MSCGNKPGSNRKRRPKCKPVDRYDTQAYGHAICYGCAAAFPTPDGLDAAGLAGDALVAPAPIAA